FMSELTEVFKRQQQQFIRFAYSYVRDVDEAEDIVMGAFTTVWERRNELLEHTNIPALLLTAVKNSSLNYLQHQEVRMNAEQRISNKQEKEMALRISTLEACDPNKLFCKEIQSLVHKAIEKLPTSSQQIFVLSRIKNLTNKEIAEQMNLSVKTVEFHITRSLKQLRTSLKDYQFFLFWL
ncbi:MAG: RNA polymerase sigma-70 factor, partial [Bacteroides sp.]